ncbi:hypothetical protein GUJ93_ZPchr0010g8751 [Zizania palustris]|uniref:Uncharacterized protein n=1 Tax=Zizania palustris TaxID=103762 RepID=A0A8J5WG06_ZIZPA|nr:hypothetical protein GUJ93_ZPchr0010g8751 [Zizania palustris]
MASAAWQEETVVLRCFDGTEVTAPARLAAGRSGLVAAAGGGVRVVEVPGNVSGAVVAAVVTYWEARAAVAPSASASAEEDRDAAGFDGEFVRGLTHDERIDLIHAAHYLADEGLFSIFS